MTTPHCAAKIPFEQPSRDNRIDRRQLLKGAAGVALLAQRPASAAPSTSTSAEPRELDVSAAARAIRNGEISSEAYATQLLASAAAHADLKCFITVDPVAVLEAARAADKARARGQAGPLLGVPIGIKDSYMTRGQATSFGTDVLGGFRPARDAAAVRSLSDAGAIVFGKNNLAEMSYGLTGHNAHHGQVKNPYDGARITGGSSSGAGAAVAARIVPAALGGDTVGSIRVPASLCGVVGFKPTPGRWPSEGSAPISETLDAAGVLARSVEDCMLIDSIVTKTAAPARNARADLRGARIAYAPRQFLEGVDPAVEAMFREVLRKLGDAGAQIVEVDLGTDFRTIVERTTWPIFFHETMPAVRKFIQRNEIPVSFEQIYEGLGSHIKGRWSRFVVDGAPGAFSEETYQAVMRKNRPELQRRYGTLAFSAADALLFPTTLCVAPTIENQWKFLVAGNEVADTFLAKNTHPANCAGLPGISIPMGLSSERLPMGLELDANVGQDRHLLDLARRVERVLGAIEPPPGL